MANPIKKYGYEGKGRTAMALLKHEIMDKILLRRTKLQCADVLALPPRYALAPRPDLWTCNVCTGKPCGAPPRCKAPIMLALPARCALGRVTYSLKTLWSHRSDAPLPSIF